MSHVGESQPLACNKHVSSYLVSVTNTYLSFVVDDRQERLECDKKAKEAAEAKAVSTSQTKLINKEGDDLMYGPAGDYAPPTLTGGKCCYFTSIAPAHLSPR